MGRRREKRRGWEERDWEIEREKERSVIRRMKRETGRTELRSRRR